MRLITQKRLLIFSQHHPDAEAGLRQWTALVKFADWQNFAQLKQSINSADIVGRAIVFNISKNKYRLIAAVHFKSQKIFILEVMTHADYSKNQWQQRYRVFQ